MKDDSFNTHLGLGLVGTGLATLAAALLAPAASGRDLGGMAVAGAVVSFLFAAAATRSPEKGAQPQKPALRLAVSTCEPRRSARRAQLYIVR